MKRLLILTVSAVMLLGSSAFAKSGGGFSFGAAFGITTADQSDLNTLRENANTREGSISVSALGNAWEGNAFIQYRFQGSSVSMQLRPSYFFQTEDGSNGVGAKFEYGVTGFTIFPMLRFALLEDKTIRFFTQIGVGFGAASGVIKEDEDSVDFSGNDVGYMAGIGAEFCFFGGSHCISIEGNYRFLNIETVTSDAVTGDFSSPETDSITHGGVKGEEVELNDKNLQVSLSGIQFMAGYAFHF